MGAPLRSVSSLTKWGPLWSVSSLTKWGRLNFFLKFYALNYSWGGPHIFEFPGGGKCPLLPPPAGAHAPEYKPEPESAIIIVKESRTFL